MTIFMSLTSSQCNVYWCVYTKHKANFRLASHTRVGSFVIDGVTCTTVIRPEQPDWISCKLTKNSTQRGCVCLIEPLIELSTHQRFQVSFFHSPLSNVTCVRTPVQTAAADRLINGVKINPLLNAKMH